MRRVHIVQLRLELQTKLNLLLVVFSILSVILLELHPQLLFIRPLPLKLLSVLSQSIISVSKNFLMIGLLLEFSLVLLVNFILFSLVLL